MMRHLFFLVLIGLGASMQTSLLVHLAVFGVVPNIVVGVVVAAALVEHVDDRGSYWYALAGGFLLDVFAASFFGFWTLPLLLAVVLAKLVVKSYVRPPILSVS